MTHPSIQKLYAFILTIMMFFVAPGIGSAQKKCPKGNCPKGYICLDGNCVKYLGCNCLVRPISAACAPVCGFFAPQTPENDLISVSQINSNGIGLELSQAQNVSLKIYDITGRLVKNLGDSRMSEGEHQIVWNKEDENTITAGIYILRLQAGTYSRSKRITVIK